jgi:AAA family ATP:ADP antiporter
MKEKLLRFMSVEPDEAGRVGLLFLMGIFMGMFIATMSVASQSLLLSIDGYSEQNDLPYALLFGGLYGLGFTSAYNFLQNRIPFPVLGAISLLITVGLTAFIEYGGSYFSQTKDMYEFAFTMIIPFSFLTFLVYWGSFSRLFNLRQAKRLVGTVDMGAMFATFIAFFSIPVILNVYKVHTESLYTVGLISIVIFTILFIFLSFRHVNKVVTFQQERKMYKKLQVADFIKNRYLLYMSLFIIFSMVAINFVDYSFLNVTTLYMDPKSLANFISLFEGTIVIFTFLLDVFATDRLISQYGMRVTLLFNPLMIGVLCVIALFIGSVFGYNVTDNSFVIYFMVIAMSKLFIRSLKEAVDNPTFKLYLLPIQSHIRIDVQTKIEGVVTSFANVAAAGLIILITQTAKFDLIYITGFSIPAFIIWFYATNRMHKSYRQTLQQALVEQKEGSTVNLATEYTVNSLLEKQVSSSAEDKVIYGLKLMEKLEPTLFENAVISLTASDNRKIKKFAEEKVQELGIEKDDSKTDIRTLAQQAAIESADSDLLSISTDNLMKLSKSIKQNDRVLGAKLLRRLISHKTIFILLELLRDVDPKVRYEALLTARKVKRQETWPILIEMLSSPTYGHHAAAALKEAGEIVLPTLEAAFHKSGQTDLVMLRIVQIIGRIGGQQALDLLWKKADFPDKRIVKQILYSFRYVNYQAKGREARDVYELLDTEISKTMWNLAALNELPETPEFYFLREALKDEVEENYDHVTILLSILYDPKSVQLVRENLQTGEPDSIAFAMELLDLFIDQNLKPKLFPLLDDSPTSEKLALLQLHFPRESYTPIQVINYILNRDFNLNNRWTKACAIHMCAYIPEFRVSRGLAAQVFNHDRLLQETAAWVIYNKEKKAFEAIRDRIPGRDKKFLDNSIEKNQLLDGLDDGFFLGIEIVMFLKTVHVFRNIQGSILSDLADKVQPIDLQKGEQLKFSTKEHNAPIFIIAHGTVDLRNEDQVLQSFAKGDVYGDLFQDGPPVLADNLVATDRSVVFKIDIMDFYFVMANHHELVQGLIKNITDNTKEKIAT